LNKFVDNEYLINRISEGRTHDYQNLNTVIDVKTKTSIVNTLNNYNPNNPFFRKFMWNSSSNDVNKRVFDTSRFCFNEIKKSNKCKH